MRATDHEGTDMDTATAKTNGEAGTPLLVSMREAAQLLGVCARTVWGLTRAGELPCVRIGVRVLYSPDTLRRWVAARERASKE
jgi:excisionase family DNA binding protein